MKKFFTLMLAATACMFTFARSFDGTEKIYLKAKAVSWWTNDNCTQRAVLDNATPAIGVVEDEARAIYAFTIPAGDYTTIRFERCESAEATAWNATGEITIPAEGDYVTSFDQNSSEATWETYSQNAPAVYTTHHITLIDSIGIYTWYIYAWGDSEAFGAWPGTKEHTLEFQAVDGEVELHLIIHNNIGEEIATAMRFLFDITEARDYILVVTTDGIHEQGTVEPTYSTYHINVSNSTGWDAFYLYAWGTPNEPTGGWPGAQGNSFDFTVADGSTVDMHLMFHNNVGEGVEGDLRLLFDITEARDYNLTVTATEVIESTTAIDQIVDRQSSTRKLIKDGQILILHDGKTFNALGTQL